MVVKQTKTEIDISRLLPQCEAMASEAQLKNQPFNWRLPRYLKHLEKQMEVLEKENPEIGKDTLREYHRKINFLKDIVKSEEMLDPMERTMLCPHLLPSAVISSSSHSIEHDLAAKEIHLQVKTKHQKNLRKELFGEDDTTLRKRKGTTADDSTTKDNIDDIIKQHHDMQEKVAEEMIRMAQSMKHNSLVARDIIKADNQVLDQATKLTEKNSVKLKTESDRLEELNKKRCSWTIWIMLIIVCIVFFNMIIFIKFFPKRQR